MSPWYISKNLKETISTRQQNNDIIANDLHKIYPCFLCIYITPIIKYKESKKTAFKL